MLLRFAAFLGEKADEMGGYPKGIEQKERNRKVMGLQTNGVCRLAGF